MFWVEACGRKGIGRRAELEAAVLSLLQARVVLSVLLVRVVDLCPPDSEVFAVS